MDLDDLILFLIYFFGEVLYFKVLEEIIEVEVKDVEGDYEI